MCNLIKINSYNKKRKRRCFSGPSHLQGHTPCTCFLPISGWIHIYKSFSRSRPWDCQRVKIRAIETISSELVSYGSLRLHLAVRVSPPPQDMSAGMQMNTAVFTNALCSAFTCFLPPSLKHSKADIMNEYESGNFNSGQRGSCERFSGINDPCSAKRERYRDHGQ